MKNLSNIKYLILINSVYADNNEIYGFTAYIIDLNAYFWRKHS